MITQIDIANFRSISNQQIPLRKLNILYGPNGSGKSSVMYAPYVMRNLFVNPNQRLNSLFNLGFINLGPFNAVVHNQNENGEIDISVKVDLKNLTEENDNLFTYRFQFSESFSTLTFNFQEYSEGITFDLPWTLTEKKQVTMRGNRYLWNGITFVPFGEKGSNSRRFNSVYEQIKKIEVISVKRGFFSPIFSTEQATEESLFAMQIRDEGTNFESKIDYYFRQLFNKTFRFVAIPGSTSFYLRTQNSRGLTTDLVNEGFGVNQTVYMLIKLLKKSTSLAFIEEPEIHLHPTAQGKLIDVFTEIIKKEGKQIFLTTHSENIVSSVLSKIASGELNRDDVQFYLAVQENDETKIIAQEVNSKGQIEGGLMSFMETELGNLKTLLGL